MADNETIGRATCPVCGAPAQDVKTSKNNLMYIYCENNCRIWFAGRHRRHIAGLKAGISQQVDKIFIKSIKEKEQITNGKFDITDRGGRNSERLEKISNQSTGTNTGIDTGRRATGEFGGVSTGAGAEQPRKSWLAGILADDDGDE